MRRTPCSGNGQKIPPRGASVHGAIAGDLASNPPTLASRSAFYASMINVLSSRAVFSPTLPTGPPSELLGPGNRSENRLAAGRRARQPRVAERSVGGKASRAVWRRCACVLTMYVAPGEARATPEPLQRAFERRVYSLVCSIGIPSKKRSELIGKRMRHSGRQNVRHSYHLASYVD